MSDDPSHYLNHGYNLSSIMNCVIQKTSISQKIHEISIFIICLKMAHMKILLHRQWAKQCLILWGIAKLNWQIKHRYNGNNTLNHWGRVTHICVGKLTITGSDNGLSPGRRQAIIWTNAGILLIGPLGTNFSEISIAIEIFSFKKMHLKISSAKWRPFCLGPNVLKKYMYLQGLARS